MCDVCVMNSVKKRMLSRRDFFRASAATTAAATVAITATATASLADGHSSVVDMSHNLDENFPTYFGDPGLSREQTLNWDEHKVNLFNLTVMEHTSTHIDAPLHFSADGRSVDELTVSDLVAPLCVVDIAARAAEDADTQVTPDDLKAWIAAHGDIPQSAVVAMHSGWGGKTATDGFRNADDEGKMHFPGFHIEATQMLLETGAGAIAVDTLSLDHGISPDFPTHYGWLPTGRFGIECLANLDKMPASGATLVIGAMKTTGGTGGPARIFGMV